MTEEAWALPRKRDRFGLRTKRVHSPQLMRDIADRLERIAGNRESVASRAYVEEVLGCPFWGLRVLAIRVLAAWGGRHNKRWLMDRAKRGTSPEPYPRDRATRWRDLETKTARIALRPLLTAGDTDWLLDAFFADAGWNFWHPTATIALIPGDVLVSRLRTEMVSDDVNRRMAVLRMFTQRWTLPTAREMIHGLTRDDDADVRALAEALLRQFRAQENAAAAGSEPTPPARRPTRERSRQLGTVRERARRGSV